MVTADPSVPACLLLAEEVWGAPLHALRSLDAAGARTLVATAGRGAHVFGRSRVRPQVADLDPDGGDAFLEQALAWARRNVDDRPIVVLAFSDRITEAMHRNRRLLASPFRPVLAPAHSLARLIDKESSMAAAERAGLAVPPWRVLRRPDDVELIGELDTPIVLKPASWASSDGAGFKISVHAEHRVAAFAAQVPLEAGATLIAQEYREVPVDAVELGITWRSADGTSTVVCTGRKRRQSTADGGVMAWGETADLPDVEAAATAFMDETGFRGTGGIELVRTADGLEFIEFNPRIEAIHFLAAAAGLDVVRLAYDDVGLGRRPHVAPRQERAAAWVGSAWFERLRSSPADWPLMLRDRMAFGRFRRRSRAVLSWTDPLPAAALTADVAVSGIRRLSGRRRAT